MLHLMALATGPRYKLRSVVFCINKFYKITCINVDDDNVSSKKDIRDHLEYMYKSCDLSYSHYKNLY